MLRADQQVISALAGRQRCAAMAAGIAQAVRHAPAVAVQDEVAIEHPHPQRGGAQVGADAGGIPVVDEHARPPVSARSIRPLKSGWR